MKKIFYLISTMLLYSLMNAQVVTVLGNTHFTISSGADVVVPGGVTINGTGTLSNSGTLSLTGDWSNSGTVNIGNGPVTLNGSGTAQNVSGATQFYDLYLNNSSGATLQSGANVSIFDALNLENGTFNTTSGTMTLLSTSVTQCAIINNFSGGYSGGMSGNVTAQRFYGAASASNDFRQHMLGSPVGGINVSAMGSTSASSAYYQAATGGAHNCNELLGETGTPYGNVFSYDETHASSCTMDGWLVDAASTAVSTGIGYSVVLGGGSGTLSLTGPANLSSSYNPSTTNSGYPNTTSDQGRVYTSGINLLSNPYSASLDPAKLIADNSNYNAAVYVWNESTGSYFQPSTIAPFQAFKVIRSAAGTGNYVVNGTSRTLTAGTFQRTVNPIELRITAANTTSGLTDETTVGFNPNATAQFDPAYDLIKLPGALNRHTLYSVTGNDWMWRNILSSISQTGAVAVGFEPGVSGSYVFNFGGLNSFDPTTYILLEDKQQGLMYNIRNGDYNFTSSATDDWNRFVLHFTPPAEIQTTDATCSSEGMINITQPGTAEWNYVVSDNNNNPVAGGTLNETNPISITTTAGIYTLTLTANTGYTVMKTIEVNGTQPVVASFTSSASSVNVDEEITFNGTSNGTALNTWNFGDGATGNGTTVSHAYANEGVYNVTLNSTSASGCNSSASSTITVTRSVTGVTDLNDINNILIWSNEDIVNIDFTLLNDVQANIEIYNILGQKLCEDKYVTSTVYHKQIPNIEEGYIVVSVKNNDAIITKKLFISNVK